MGWSEGVTPGRSPGDVQIGEEELAAGYKGDPGGILEILMKTVEANPWGLAYKVVTRKISGAIILLVVYRGLFPTPFETFLRRPKIMN